MNESSPQSIHFTISPENLIPPNFFSKRWVNQILKRYQIGEPLGALINIGNSCFMNAVLECLAYCPGLSYFAERIPNVIYERNLGEPLFLHHFGVLCKELKLRKAVSPSIFYDNLSIISPDMQTGMQQDAHEFLFALLNRFDDECAKAFLKDHEVFQTPIHAIFGGVIEEKRTCKKCGYQHINISRFLDLTVGVDSFSIEECIQNTMFSGEIDRDYTCEKCGSKGTSIRESIFTELPNVFIITLMRYKSDGTKLENKIDFDLTLNVSNCTNPGIPAEYRLFALINHSGHQISHGHFSNKVQTSNGDWYNVDDGHITKESSRAVLQSRPYILFYKKAELVLKKPAIVRFGIPKPEENAPPAPQW